MKKIVLIIMATIMACCCISPAYAAGVVTDSPFSAEVVNLAYMDLDSANVDTHASILQARRVIIENSTWVADDLNGWIEDEEGNIIEVVPHFHEIFPADWEIPTYPTSTSSVESVTPRSWQESFSNSVTLSSSFQEFHTVDTGEFAGLIVDQISTVGRNYGYTYSIEYYNTTSNKSCGSASDLSSGKSFNIEAPTDATISIRAKSSRTLGWWMTVATDRISAN